MTKSENRSPVLSVRDLSISFGKGEQRVRVLNRISFDLHSGECLGIVGESGSGKSLTSLAIMQLLPDTAIVDSGQVLLLNQDVDRENLIGLDESSLRKIRGRKISMIFQEPMTSLNPTEKCGNQVSEAILHHLKTDRKNARDMVLDLFEQVGLPRPEKIFESYPHEISGGQKQRVMIAMALSCDPELIIADEPTTALDVTVQRKVLEILKDLCLRRGIGLIFITHDLGVVAQVATKVMVMYRGDIKEIESTAELFRNPKDPYTQALIACRPKLDNNPTRLREVGTAQKEEDSEKSNKRRDPDANKIISDRAILEVENLIVQYPLRKNFLGKPTAVLNAVDSVSFRVIEGETLGLVGESGCGKTSLGRAIIKLIPSFSGTIKYRGEAIEQLSDREFLTYRKRMQIIFQDPYSSLNPRKNVLETLVEPMRVHSLHGNASARRAQARKLIDQVGLPHSAERKYPHEFSGGQRQRICIARALAVEPEFIICDESVSALDVSVQARVLNLLNDLKDEFGLTYIFISHDLSVVKYMSNHIAVMKSGKIEEFANGDEIYTHPKSTYTKDLIEAIPQIPV